jgi:hypothetical protein
MPCGSCKNRRFGGSFRINHQGDNNMRATNNIVGVRFEVFTAVTMKNGVFWVVTPCGSCKNRRFGGTFLRSVCRLLVAACVVPSSPIFVTLMKEAPGSSETSVLTILSVSKQC